MATYRQIHVKIWSSPDFQELSSKGKLVFIYLFSNSHRNEAALYRITFKTIANETDLTVEEVDAAIAEAERINILKYDRENHIVWVVNAVKYQKLSPNGIKAILNNLRDIDHQFTEEFKTYYADIISAYEGTLKVLNSTLEGPPPNGKGNGNCNDNDKKTHLCADAHKHDQTNTQKNTGGAQQTAGIGNENVPPAEKPANNKEEYTPEFNEFWSIYPRNAEKKGAFRAWKARLKEGVQPEVLINAAKNYADFCKATGTEERFIKHAKTFLGPSKPYEDFLKPREDVIRGPTEQATGRNAGRNNYPVRGPDYQKKSGYDIDFSKFEFPG